MNFLNKHIKSVNSLLVENDDMDQSHSINEKIVSDTHNFNNHNLKIINAKAPFISEDMRFIRGLVFDETDCNIITCIGYYSEEIIVDENTNGTCDPASLSALRTDMRPAVLFE